MRGFLLKVKNFNDYKLSKKAVTFAGAMVFFFLLGLVPTMYLFSLTLSLFGKKLSLLGGFFITEEFSVIKEFIFTFTENVGAGGSVIAGFIAVYSAGSFFVHLRLMGEAIYNHKSANTFLIRILSIISAILISLVTSFLVVVYAFLSPITIKALGVVGKIFNVILIMLIIFVAIVIINLFTCPYKLKIKEVLSGSLFTLIFSIIFTLVFLVYLKYFSSYDKIYGKIAVIPIFLVWLFIIMRCLVNGITLNSYFLGRCKRLTKKPKYSKI